jgi:hypothetical protein
MTSTASLLERGFYMYLAITAVLGFTMAFPAADSGSSQPGSAEAQLLKLANAERTALNLPTLQRLGRTELRASTAAENVALDRNVVEAHRSLMSSPLHRANVLDPDLLSIGIGVVKDEDLDVIYVVQDFASPMARLSQEGAVGMIRRAVRRALEKAILPPIEDRALSRRLAKDLKVMVAADSVDIREDGAPGWIIAYTTPDPSRLPDDARSRIQLADSYAFAVEFARAESSALGIYWVLLALRGTHIELTAD